MEDYLEKTYKAKKSHFLFLLFFVVFFAFLSGFSLNALLISDSSYPQMVIIIYFSGSLSVCFILTCQVLTRFHTVKIGPSYLTVKNYRYYYPNTAISSITERLIKYKLAHLVTVKEKYQYSFFIVVNEHNQKPKKFHFQSNCYADFNNLYDALSQKIKPLQG